MTGWVAVLALGFFLGMRHATDPDHVLAVTTIVARYHAMREAALIGICWGIGHTITILIVGGGIILFGWVIPPRAGLSIEFAVGIMLVLLGVFTLWSLFRRVDETVVAARGSHGHVHSHAHSHGDYIHTHPHGHDPETHPHPPERTPVVWLDRHFGRVRGYRLLRPFLIGMVHGLAGSAAVALLVLAAIQSTGWALFYLMLFGAGTIVGMMTITIALAVPFAYTDRRFARLNRGLRFASGVLSLAFGLFIAWQIGVVDGLFSGQPLRQPH